MVMVVFENPCQTRILIRFSQRVSQLSPLTHSQCSSRSRMKSRKSASRADCSQKRKFMVAPFMLHAPVNELHSIEFKAFRFLLFSLTQEIEGVKHNCSLTVSKFFRLVRRPGVKQGHLPQTARVLTREKLGNQQITRTELRQDDERRASEAL